MTADLGLPWLDRSDVDPFPWSPAMVDMLRDWEDVTCLQLEAVNGTPIAWAPLGSKLPFQSGEGIHWRVRKVTL